ncbi:OmpA family protein [Bacteroides sp. 519]|uniref:OmpA family protein n=1 Tax=Bacteroides sp. 519 TaxID=2302937 RepID=UPI0013D60D4F|nr:OmpA family protein [Bacteroides sp. 519]NDV58374.1 OmpA family protein [Bacteroides sp. 519]
MKSKLVILSLLLAGVVSSATAQTKEKFYSESWKHNWYIGISGGVQTTLNPEWHDQDGFGLGDVITPKIALTFGKLIDPVWGIRGQANGVWGKIVSNYGRDSYDVVKKKFVNLHLDGTFNLSNALAGYNPNRLFTLSVFAGPGMSFAKNTIEGNNDLRVLVNGSAGLIGQFNVNKHIDITIEARGEVSPSIYGKYSEFNSDGAISVLAGVSYTFGGKKFIPVGAKIDTDALNAEINKYRNALSEAEAELAAAKNALANMKPVKEEVVKEIEVAGPRAVFFQIGKSNIDDYGMVNIQLAAKIIKANPNKKYKVAGYADKATGSSSWNQKLSEKRAQAVYDALIKEGVSSSSLELVGFGGTANMFGQNKLNRVVILE